MSLAPPCRSILASAALRALACAGVTLLGACGQRGPLYIPDTPAAAQRATLPQVLTGRGESATAAGEAASAPALPRAPVLPNIPDIQQ